ncbi:immunoglobulin I-set domain protein [Cooperia oncophora]
MPLFVHQRSCKELSGRPAPSVEWFDNNGQLISDSEQFKIENAELSTVLTIKRLRVEDRGEFKLRIRNRCGEDSFSIGIQVTFESALSHLLLECWGLKEGL